jgi:hypothetical protein
MWSVTQIFFDIDLSNSDVAEDLQCLPASHLSCEMEQLTSCDAALLNTDSSSVQSHSVLKQGLETLPAVTGAETLVSSNSCQLALGLVSNGDLAHGFQPACY